AARRKGDQVMTLSTIHSAKGLEFERVFMIDLLEGILPSAQDIRQEQLEEATRLFYVGMTRAKHRLELITYMERGGEKAQESRFVTALRAIVNPVSSKVNHTSFEVNHKSNEANHKSTEVNHTSSEVNQRSSKVNLHPHAITSKQQLHINME